MKKAKMINHSEMRYGASPVLELTIVSLALLMLLAAQWALSISIHGTNYFGWDGKQAQATVLAAFRYGRLFDLTYISPIDGVGSQMATMNVWANFSFWPFAFVNRELATDISALLALGTYMTSCYVMARCFDVPVVPSAIAAQLCILLFAPALLLVRMPTNFCLNPADAVVYAPYMVALGLLARIEPGSWRRFALLTLGIFIMAFYSIYADPLWAMVGGYSWAVAFAVVTLSPLRINIILLRFAALSCCAVLLVILGTAGYLETISQYTARVQYPALTDRPRTFTFVSTLAWSTNMRAFYVACTVGWLLGLVILRGRARVLVTASVISFTVYVAYSTAYLLLANAVWIPPIPLYLEHSLCALYIAGAVTGYCGLLLLAVRIARRRLAARGKITAMSDRFPPLSLLFGIAGGPQSRFGRAVTLAIALLSVALVPAKVVDYVFYDSPAMANIYYQPWPDEPELINFLSETLSADVGQPLQGSIAFSEIQPALIFTPVSAWALGIQTVDAYSQLVTPQAVYFIYAMLKQKEVLGAINSFIPYPGDSWETFGRVMQMFGMRFYLSSNGHATGANQAGYPLITLPRRSLGQKPDLWYIYEYPHPNVGNYSPTQITGAQSAAEIIDKISAPNFDFTTHAVLSEPINTPLVPANGMRLSRARGGFHISGTSAGTSLVVLPLQFSHCLRAADSRVRFVRANLLMAGIIFSRTVDTDILFDYGIFSPGCRRADLAEFKRLGMKIELRMPQLTGDRLFVDWKGVVARLREVGAAVGVLRPSPEGISRALRPKQKEQII
jgi:hypothetical protein